MTRTFALTIIITALLCGAASSAAGLEIEASFQLGNLGFTPTRDPADATYTGADYFWGGSLFLTQNFSSSIQVDAALNRDLIVGNSLSALFQYKTDYFRVGIGPYLGLLNSSSTILKSGISSLLRAEFPGVAFVSLRTDGSLGALTSTGDNSAQRNEIILGFYIRNSAICSFGLSYKELDYFKGSIPVIDSLTAYSFDVKVFEKNVPYRLDFNFAYEALLRRYDDPIGPSHGLASAIVGAGIDLLISPAFALTFGLRTSVWTFGTDFLSGFSDIGFSPFLFQGSAGFRIVLPDSDAPAPPS
ncbi:MAG: hypothetical protein ABSB63_07710 [Spirochaetia bacterium]|jgi:hypothetical protein